MKKFLFFVTTLCTSLTTAGAEYAAIKKEFMYNFPFAQSPQIITKNGKNKGFTFPEIKPTPYEKHTAFFSIFIPNNIDTNKTELLRIDEKTISDLNLFFYNSEQPENAVVEKIYRGKTLNGKIATGRMLLSYIDNSTELKKRQDLLSYIMELQPEKLQPLMALFNELEALEDTLYSLWRSNDALYSPFVKSQYFSGKFKKHQKKSGKDLLEFRRRIADFEPLLMQMASEVIVGLIQGARKQSTSPFDYTPPAAQAVTHLLKKEYKKAVVPGLQSSLSALVSGILFAVLRSPSFVGIIESRKQFVAQIKKRFMPLVQFADIVKKIYTELKKDRLLLAAFDPKHTLKQFVYGADKKQKALFDALSTSSFRKDKSYFLTHYGAVIQIIPLFLAAKNTFKPIFEAIGTCEATIGLATLYKEKKSSSTPWSFVEYVHKAQPYFNLVDYAHPSLSSEQAVLNSLELGTQHHGIIVTGPNASGKSVSIRAIMLCILFGQSIGIAPARKTILTPMTKILSYLNPIDNIAEGKSLFQAEEDRINDIVKTAMELPADKFSFIVADELLSGTAPTEGEAATWGIAYGLAQLPNCMPIMATHFPKLTSLAAHTNGFYVNYHVSVDRTGKDDFIHTFKLEPGRSHQVIALDLARKEGFDSDILDVADTFLAKKGFKRGRTT